MPWLVFLFATIEGAVQPSRSAVATVASSGCDHAHGRHPVLPVARRRGSVPVVAEEVQQGQGGGCSDACGESLRLTDADLIERFAGPAQDYAAVEAQASSWRSACARGSNQRSGRGCERGLSGCDDSTLRSPVSTSRRSRGEPRRSNTLARIAQALAAGEASSTVVAPAAIQAYRHGAGSPGHVRMSIGSPCIWLIRRFITPSAVIRYRITPEAEEVAFDMRKGASVIRQPVYV